MNELILVLRKFQGFIEADSFGMPVIRASLDFVTAEDGLEKWRTEEKRPIVSDLIHDIQASLAGCTLRKLGTHS